MTDSMIPSGRNRDDRPDMRDVNRYIVRQYAAQWERLGLELGLNDYDIANISKDNEHNPNRSVTCCRAVLEQWLRDISSPTWGKLDDAVKKIKLSNSPVLFYYEKEQPAYSLEDLRKKFEMANPQITVVNYNELNEQQKKIFDEVQAMIIVVNQNEFMATMCYLKPPSEHSYILEVHGSNKVGSINIPFIFFIGMFGKCPVAVTRVDQGHGRDVIYHIRCFKNILLIAAVGVAAGFPENKVHYGDVIISERIQDCSIYRQKDGTRIPRGDTIPGCKYMIHRLQDTFHWEFVHSKQGTKSSVIFGLFLSKPLLLDIKGGREEMLRYFGSDAKGFEMKGFSITGFGIEWIIIKGVCDYASGKGKEWQPTAALAANDYLYHHLSQFDISSMKAPTDDLHKEDHDDKLFIQNMLHKAKAQDLTLKLRHAKILFCGSAKSGKSSFARLLRNKKHEEKYESTPVADTKQLFVSAKVSIKGMDWIDLDSNLEIKQLTKRFMAKLSQQSDPLIDKPLAETSNKPSLDETKTTEENSNAFNLEINPESPADRQILVETKITSDTNVSERRDLPEVWDVITLLDTGGQPEFINLLPTINISADMAIVIFSIQDGVDCLNKPAEAQHSNENYEKYELSYSTFRLLKCLLSGIEESALQKRFYPKEMNVQEIQHPRKTVVYFVGTHADKIQEQLTTVVDVLDKKIAELIVGIDDKKIIIQNDSGDPDKYLHPVDNTVPREETDKYSLKLAQRIRQESKKILDDETPCLEIPITWFILELELRLLYETEGKVCVPLSEVKQLTDNITKDDKLMELGHIKEVLKFFHLFGVLLYFDEVDGMNDYVVTNPQWLFNNLNKIIECKFAEGMHDVKAINRIKNEGIFSKSLLNDIHLDIQDLKFGSYNEPLELFVNLLVYLRIFAQIDDNDFFMPSVLPICDRNVDEQEFFNEKDYGKLVVYKNDTVKPLLIEFDSGLIPRGLFGLLVVQLLQNNKDYSLYGKNTADKLCRCSDLISFFKQPCYYITLQDKILYLELQVRVTYDDEPSILFLVQENVTDALKVVLEKCHWEFNDLRYGFLCECMNGQHHLSRLAKKEPFPQSFPKYSYCEYRGTRLSEVHSIWFSQDVCPEKDPVDCHYLLWQELNNKLATTTSHIFVMALAQPLCCHDYDVHDELAPYRMFNLVNHPIACAINYSPKSSLISGMWNDLLKEKGPEADKEHQPAFEEARSKLYVDNDENNHTKLYQDYLNNVKSLNKKEQQIKKKCRDQHGDQWEKNFTEELKASEEYKNFQYLEKEVQPYLDAIEVQKHGPLVHRLNHMKDVMEENARSVTDHDGKPLKYYHVTLQPSSWYQWFKHEEHDEHEEGVWTQISVDSKNHYADQADLYKALGGSFRTFDGLNKHSDITISLKFSSVRINRPWFNMSILKTNLKIYGEGPGSWSTGELNADNNGSFPLISTQMIVARNITVTTSTKMEQKAIDDVCSLLSVGNDSCETINNNSIKMKGTKVIGYVCELLPKFPH